jgi:hypothetical protein
VEPQAPVSTVFLCERQGAKQTGCGLCEPL